MLIERLSFPAAAKRRPLGRWIIESALGMIDFVILP